MPNCKPVATLLTTSVHLEAHGEDLNPSKLQPESMHLEVGLVAETRRESKEAFTCGPYNANCLEDIRWTWPLLNTSRPALNSG